MGKIGCYKCGKEYGTNPDCACWGYGERKGAPMRENNWWIGGWWELCPRCGLEIEDDASIYCSNCGKFLRKLRGTLMVPVLLSLAFFSAAGLVSAMWAGGLEPRNPTQLTYTIVALGIIGMLSLLLPVPLGNFVLRREKWAEEAERRNEEDRVERERSANAKAKSGIDVRIEAGDLKKAHEMLKGHMEKFSIGFGKKPSIKVPLTDKEGNPLGIIDLENGEAGATLEKMGQMSFRLGLKQDEKGILQSLLLGEPPLPREEFPLMSGEGFTQIKIGTISPDNLNALRVGISAGVLLQVGFSGDGEVDRFFLRPQLDTAFNLRSVLPVRNGPPLQIAIIDSPDNRESLEDIKRNLEEIYRVKRWGIWKKVEQLAKAATNTLQWQELGHSEGLCYEAASPYEDDGSPFLFRIRMEKPTRLWYLDHDAELMKPGDEKKRFNMLDAAMMDCELARSEILFEELEGKKAKITFTTLSKGLEKYTDIGCSCGRKHTVSHLRNDFICPCGDRYVNTSEGWRPEPRCRFRLGDEFCGIRAASRLHCNKTLDDCRRLGNEERFAP